MSNASKNNAPLSNAPHNDATLNGAAQRAARNDRSVVWRVALTGPHQEADGVARVIASSPNTLATLHRLPEVCEVAGLATVLRELSGSFGGVVQRCGDGALVFCDHAALYPVYYAVSGDAVLVSTDFGVLRAALPAGVASVDPERFAQSLSLGWIPDDAATVDPAIRKVPSGSIVSISAASASENVVRTTRYYVPDLHPGTQRFESQQLTGLLTDALSALSGRRTISGVMLSGGLDSTSVMVLAHRAGLLADDAVSWTRAATPNDAEVLLAASVAKRCGIPHVQLAVDRQAQMKVAVALLNENAPVSANAPLLSSLPSQMHGREWLGLTGFGGDPAQNISAGSVRAWRTTRSAVHRALALADFARREGRPPPLFLTSRRRGSSTTEVPETAFSFLRPSAKRVAQTALLQAIERSEKIRNDEVPGAALFASPYWSTLIAAHHEIRDASFVHPFLDWRVVEYLGSLDPVPWAVRKRALRETMRGALPESVRTRQKSVRNPTPLRISTDSADVQAVYAWLRANDTLVEATGAIDTAALMAALSIANPPRWWWPRLLILIRHLKWFSALAPSGALR